MNRKILAITFLCLLMFAVGFTVQSSRTQWEYISTASEKKLNELGAQGWELVTATPIITSGGTFGNSFFLKRPKS